MAAAERTYADPSVLLALYVHQPASTAISAWRWRKRWGALPLTLHGRLEIVNGICLAGFRKAISRDAMKDAIASFEEDISEGQYAQTDVLWRGTLQRGTQLSTAHAPTFGCRTLDVLHVATSSRAWADVLLGSGHTSAPVGKGCRLAARDALMQSD